MLTYLGSLTVGAAIPLLLAAQLQLSLSLGPIMAELTAKLAAALKLSVSLAIKPPSIAVSLQLALALVAQLQAGFTPPSINFGVSAVLQLIAELQLKIGLLQVALSLALQLEGLMGAAGVHAFVYEGPISGLPTAMGGVSASTGLPASTVVYAPIFMADASLSPTKTALQTVFVS